VHLLDESGGLFITPDPEQLAAEFEAQQLQAQATAHSPADAFTLSNRRGSVLHTMSRTSISSENDAANMSLNIGRRSTHRGTPKLIHIIIIRVFCSILLTLTSVALDEQSCKT
jgi:hypothetical protein